jgi:hypothetical protein
MKKFEYNCRFIKKELEAFNLNEYGLAGWELITVIFNEGYYSYYFKREIE